jgi:heme a synthase
MRVVPDLSPRSYRRLTGAIVAFLVIVIVSGAAVRLTNSGLGCPDWPNCNADSFVRVGGRHEAIEQLNRLLSGAIGVPIAIALIASYRRRPRRRDLIALSWTMLGLFFANAVLGGIAVMVELSWVSVMGHFLLAIALVGVALTLHRRAGESGGEVRRLVSDRARLMARVVYGCAVVVLVAGTLVTSAGPHGGDADAERLGWQIREVARFHGATVIVLLAVTLAMIYVFWRERAPRRVMVTAEVLLAAMCAQGTLGYVQYFNGIPALLVAFHVAGAVLVFSAVHQLQLELRTRVPTPSAVVPPIAVPIGETV